MAARSAERGRSSRLQGAVRQLGRQLDGLQRAHDVVLPGASGPKIAFLMYPQAETRRERIDSLDPETFKYKITTREIT